MRKTSVRLKYMGRKAKDWLINNAKYHFTDSTSLLAVLTPIFAAFETGVAGMSDEVSTNARLTAAGLTYFAGMGGLWGKGNDISRKIFKITDKSKEKTQSIHDCLYSGAFNVVVMPIVYITSGTRDVKEIAIGTSMAVAYGLTQGPVLRYAVGVGRDLVGLNVYERRTYPELVRKQRPTVKKGLAAFLTAASIGLTAGVYSLTPEKENPEVQNKVAASCPTSENHANFLTQQRS